MHKVLQINSINYYQKWIQHYYLVMILNYYEYNTSLCTKISYNQIAQWIEELYYIVLHTCSHHIFVITGFSL